MGQSQKYFFKAIYYIARGLCPNFSPLGPKLKEEIGNKGIKWPLLYIYTRKKARDFPGFNSFSWDFPCFPGISYAIQVFPMLSRNFPCLPEINHVFRGFTMPSWDFLCFPSISHTFLVFPIWVSKGRREIAADDGQAWQAEILHIIRSEISRVTLGKVCVLC